MKRFIIAPLVLFMVQISIGQNIQFEHLSHDRIASAHHGHIITPSGGLNITIGNKTSPMNTSEAVYGNIPKGVHRVHSSSSPSISKVTNLAANQKIITLLSSGNSETTSEGVFSIRQSGNLIEYRNVLEIDGDNISIVDAIFPNSAFDNKYLLSGLFWTLFYYIYCKIYNTLNNIL